MSQTEFDRATAIEPLGDGGYAARMDTGWWVVRGPNGGYVAAVLLRALAHAAGDTARAPRSLTVHYAAAPEEGPVEIDVRVERRGRSLSSLSARMTQDGKLVALALAAFSAPWPDRHDFDGLTPPDAGRPGEGALAMTDAWFPAAFTRLTEPAGLPTIDLTIHFRAPLPLESAAADDWLLAVFRSRYAREGFVEEDGEIWSAGGELVAQSRQLAVMV